MRKAKKIYYFGTYDTSESRHRRRYTLSATSKMDYIISAINQIGYDVELISSSYIIENKWCFDFGGKRKINENSILNLSPSFGYKTKIGKFLSISFTSLFFFFKLLKIKSNETLIVYHATWYSILVLWAKWIKGFQLIVEVEEIYTHAFNRNPNKLKSELHFIKQADKLILVNDLLAGYLEFPKDKVLISYGSYLVSENESCLGFADNKIHLVYAGSFSKRKSGAQSAVAAAMYLPDEYVMHLLGFGDNETTNELKEQIEEVNNKSKCKVIFEGEKRGKEYEEFMRRCDIGLCTQKLDCDYTEFAFPSKVLAYLGFGLNVVTAPLVSLPVSSLNNYLFYYRDDTPQCLAEAIQGANIFPKEELKDVVRKLHGNFLDQLLGFIKYN